MAGPGTARLGFIKNGVTEMKKNTLVSLRELKRLVANSNPKEESYQIDVLLTKDVVAYLLRILDKNQRHLNKSVVMRLQHQIETNGYFSNMAYMKISNEGTFFDGQHRLNAVKNIQDKGENIAPRQTLIMNASRDEIILSDTGKSRSNGDALRISGYDVSASAVSAMRFRRSCNGVYYREILTNDEIVRIAQKQSWSDFVSIVPKNFGFSRGGIQYQVEAPMLYVMHDFLVRYGSSNLVQFCKEFQGRDTGNAAVEALRWIVITYKDTRRLCKSDADCRRTISELMHKTIQLMEIYAEGGNVPSRLNKEYEWKERPSFYSEELQ